jgi:hypothetical protein
MRSLVLIVPAAQRLVADEFVRAFGYGVAPGDSSFTVALSVSGVEPATHYGTHTYARQSFLDLLEAAAAGTLTPLPPGVDALALQSTVSAITRSVHPEGSDTAQHFEDVLAAHGLQRIVSVNLPGPTP